MKAIFTKQDAQVISRLHDMGYSSYEIADLLYVEQHTIVRTLKRYSFDTTRGRKGDIKKDYERIRAEVIQTFV
jgi:IS30 family transposase